MMSQRQAVQSADTVTSSVKEKADAINVTNANTNASTLTAILYLHKIPSDSANFRKRGRH